MPYPPLRNCLAFAFLIFVLAQVAGMLLDWDTVWMQPETLRIKSRVIGLGVHTNQPGLVFASPLFEESHRTTRPLSSAFEVLDTKFRIWLWQFTVPHPSLSLTLLFSLFLTPLSLWALFRSTGLGIFSSLLALAFYFASPGTLSLEVMYFRPAKALANFAFAAILLFASRLKSSDAAPSPRGKNAFLLSLFLFCLFDETVYLLIPLIPFLFPKLFDAGMRRRLALVVLGLAFGCIILLPFIATWWGTPANVLRYPPFQRALSAPFDSDFWRFLPVNTSLLLRESLGLYIPWEPTSPTGIIVIAFAWVACLSLVLLSASSRDRLFSLWNGALPHGATPARFIIVTLGLCLSHAFFMNTVANRYWGPYWYGAYWSVWLAWVLGYIVESSPRSWVSALAVASFSLSNLYTFPFTNRVYRDAHYYPNDTPKINAMFDGRLNRFAFEPARFPRHDLTRKYWIANRRGKSLSGTQFPKELLYLPLEASGANIPPGIRFAGLSSDPSFVFQMP